MTSTIERAARCICGGLTVTARREPDDVYLCSCAYCQRKSGSAFTYAAIYPEGAVTISGECRTWRHRGDAGRDLDSNFCPACGASVFFRAEALPGMVGVAVGCFADPDFEKPRRLFWASKRHCWLDLGEDVPLLETQSD
jgi:hypothetical protein